MARKRVPATHDINAERRRIRKQVQNAGKLYQRVPGVPQEHDVTILQESERFSWEQAQGDFIPFTYDPTKTSYPGNGWDHPRTSAAGYDRNTGILRVKFWTDGAIYDYGTITPVPPYVAYQFRATDSPGRFINSTLETYGYIRR